ncbi:Myotubularin-related protein 9 [Collichthys lucidus]|uniref:Myotubularin-related protein 9 n=1 Tax=Collichthys lucidus TaxID=240159 RepID=A0A4U5UNJ5_COLLU|nr:Myotubularin-related protein 9 [Collichthys lucidus]
MNFEICHANRQEANFHRSVVSSRRVFVTAPVSPNNTLEEKLHRSGHGVCRVDKDAQGGWGCATPAFHAHCGGDPVSDWSPLDPLLQTGQHGGAVAASLKHRLHREEQAQDITDFIVEMCLVKQNYLVTSICGPNGAFHSAGQQRAFVSSTINFNFSFRFVGSVGSIIVKCKDLRVIQLDIPGMEECLNIASSIEALSTLDLVSLMYPFFYRPMFEVIEDGWNSFLPEAAFKDLESMTDEWRLSEVNKDFSVCPSYPPLVAVPKDVDDDTLRKVATFRHSGRFPVLSYYHKKNGMVMMRASQPLTGTNGRRCKEDEKLINATLRPGKRGYIIDTRTINVAQQAKARGGGFESEANYPQWRRIHKALERSNVLQESLIKLVEACNDQSHSMDRWLSKLEASNWQTHVKEILTTACLAAQCIDREGASVLVHGTEGTDSTLQVTSLAQIILDPACRTIRGFQGLVEREWLQAGHPFQQRCAQSAYSNSKPRQEAPVFLLFLDCVWQILRQFPCSFEFSESFLVLLFEHAYASQFGTFLGNSTAERAKLSLPEKTVSLWSWVNRPQELERLTNPLYEANSLVIWPSVAPQSLLLWEGVFLRWNRSSKCLDEAYEEMVHIIEYNKELQNKVNTLRRQLAQLETEDPLLQTP